jgi:transposase InsO family protein
MHHELEQWRHHFNTVRPHSALGYRPPAPEAALSEVSVMD